MKENKRLTFIMDMVDKLTLPATNATKSLKTLGADVTATQKKLAGLGKQAGDIKGLERMRTEMVKHQETTKLAADRLAKLEKAHATMGKASGVTKTQINQARKEHEKAVKATGEHKQVLDKLEEGLRKAGVNTKNLQEATRRNYQAQAQTTNELRKQQAALDATTKRQDALTKAKERYAKSEQQAQKMMGFGAKGMAAGAAMMGGTYAAGSKFTSYDHQLSAVQAVGRLTGDQKKQLSAVIEELAAKSSFNANEAAGAAGFMAQAGFGKDQIEAALGPVMSLAAATGSDLTRTADISSNIMSAFEIGADEMPRVADVLTMAANSFNVDLGMLGESMKYLGPVASKLGISLEEATAMTGLLGNVGIQGTQAGNALKSMAGSLAAPNKAKDKILDDLGIKTKDKDGNLRAMPEIMLELKKKTKGMGNADMTAMFKTLFGQEFYGPAMEIVSKGGDALESAVKTLHESEGAAAEAERVRLDNLAGDFTKFGSAAEGISIKLGKSMDPIYRKLMSIANGVMEKINKWMQENPKLVRQIGMVVSVLGAVLSATSALIVGLGALWLTVAKGRLLLGLLRWAFGGVIKNAVVWTAVALKNVAAMALQATWWVTSKTAMLAWNVVCGAAAIAMRALNLVMSMNPIGLLIIAVGALVAAGIWLYQNWERLPEIFSNLWTKITEMLAIDPMAIIKDAWGAVDTYFTDLFGGIWDKFTGLFSGMISKIKSLGSVFGDFWSGSDLEEQVKDAPKAGEETPKVDGKPLTKGNQVTQTKQQVVNVTPAPVNITIQSSGGDAQEIARQIKIALDQRDREAAREARGAYRDT